MDQGGNEATQDVKDHKRDMAQFIFYIIAKDPEVEHIASQMENAPVEEHTGEEGNQNRYVVLVGELHTMEKLIGNEAIDKGQGMGTFHQQRPTVVHDQQLDLGTHNGAHKKEDQNFDHNET